jgi:hypothetical protein
MSRTYLKELQDFKIGELSESSKGEMVIRVIFVCTVLIVATLLAYHVVSVISLIVGFGVPVGSVVLG